MGFDMHCPEILLFAAGKRCYSGCDSPCRNPMQVAFLATGARARAMGLRTCVSLLPLRSP